jgi:superfamily II DNA or RNA helicase
MSQSEVSESAVPTAVVAELARLRAENARLLRLLELSPEQAATPVPAQGGLALTAPGPVTARSSAAAKVRFFCGLFAARPDVYALRWENTRTGRAGWVPAVEGGWRRGTTRPYLPVTDAVITAHLRGESHLGLYPLLANDHCWWLAADFDGASALLDALTYLKAARAIGAPAALEVSRSGIGAHVWIFFAAPVPAATARALGTGLLREAMSIRGQMNLSSYDRLFPAQDFLPSSGAIGNLIAAPLQRHCRDRGATVFLDLATLEPHRDQWAYLSGLARLSPGEVDRLASKVAAVRTGTSVDRVAAATATGTHPVAPARVELCLDAGAAVAIEALTPATLAALKHAASLPNPEFHARQRRRQSTWNVPRFLCCYEETLDGWLRLPRGLGELAANVLTQAGSQVTITDHRAPGAPHRFTLVARLRPEQTQAMRALLAHDHGVLVAEPGAGKTVVAAAVIATVQVSTLVLVDRKALAEQWRQRVGQLLGETPGQLGGGRSKLTGTLDVITLQTLARRRRSEVAELCGGYGLVVVDECHHAPAAAFEHALAAIPARRWLGLTATPYRRDQLDTLISHQLGPTRHTITPSVPGALPNPTPAPASVDGDDGLSTVPSAANQEPLPVPERHLVVHDTGYRYRGPVDPAAPGGIAAIYRDLATDRPRLAQITTDVVNARHRGRHCLVLTPWRHHLDTLTDALEQAGHPPTTLHGGLGARARREALAQLDPQHRDPEQGPIVAVATAGLIGEGFDQPALDTLFLAAPIAWRGRLEQHVGRVLRPHPGKTTAEVHDYHDPETGILAASLAKRAPGYRRLNFPDPRHITHQPPPTR